MEILLENGDYLLAEDGSILALDFEWAAKLRALSIILEQMALELEG